MYKAFKLNATSPELEDLFESMGYGTETLKAQGQSRKTVLTREYKDILYKSIDDNGVIVGEQFIKEWFPVNRMYDVFISYSHDDADLALKLVGFLVQYFGLNVFIDETVWGSADTLIKQLNDTYNEPTNGAYNCRDYDFYSSHVHVMLTTAIMKAIDQSEIVIFINTNNSTYTIGSKIDDSRTKSPWIYEEIYITSIIKETAFEIYRNGGKAYFENQTINSAKDISYKLPDNKLIPINELTLRKWCMKWKERKTDSGNSRYGKIFCDKSDHPLDILYKSVVEKGVL
ncbi:MAG: hypothetical protein PUG04_04880 [Lachnospiraceae bacterium]|nr:hypothetical protein [Lachnospiraceae bacterium]